MSSREAQVSSTALVFGASGAIGSEIALCLEKSGLNVIRVGRAISAASSHPAQSVSWSLDEKFSKENFGDIKKIDAVVWAQGANYNDFIADFDRERHLEIYTIHTKVLTQRRIRHLKLLVVPRERRVRASRCVA